MNADPPVAPSDSRGSTPESSAENLESLDYTTSGVDAMRPLESEIAYEEKLARHHVGPNRRLLITASIGLSVLLLGTGLFATRHKSNDLDAVKSGSFNTVSVPLSDVPQLTTATQAANLRVNGQLNAASSVVVEPSAQPSKPVVGQIYFDKTTNQLQYYNGTSFVSLGQHAVTSLGGVDGDIALSGDFLLTGNRLTLASGVRQQPATAGVASFQGQTGAVTLTAGSGVSINGTTITNSGVLSLAGGNGLQVSSASGAVTVSLPQALGTTSTPTFGGLQLSSALGVAYGGTGLTAVASNQLLLGGAANTITQLANAAAGQCLVSNGIGAAPSFQACTGSSGVSSINGLNGAVTVANASAGGSTITINNAAADGATKGIAAFNSTNFTAVGGVVNTIQNIATTSSPSFASINLTSALTVGNGGTGSTTAGGARTNLGAAASGANSDITSLSGLTTALSLAQGGTGSGSAAGARTNLGAAASGANSDITSLTGLTTALSVSQGGTGLNSVTANQILIGAGGNTITQLSNGSSGQCLVSNGAGSAPSFQACTGAGGVSSLNGQTGAVTLANASAAAGTVTIDDAKADGSTKGIATFNSTNFSAAGGVINTIQGIATTSTPTFAGITLTSALTIANGGTGSATAGGARTNLGAAASGANSDITSLSGLTTALSVGQGGTGSGTAAGARSNLGAAASGANSDITSLTGLTTALSISQGGTGLTTITANQILIGGAGNSITQLSNGSSGQCLVSNGAGSAPTFQTCTGAGGVSSINSLTGAVTLANATTGGSTITIDDAAADGVTKGIAAFVSTNFSASSGVISIKTGGVTTTEIADGTITATDIANSTITGGKIANSTIANGNLINSSLSVTAGTGLSGGGSISLGGSASLSVVYGSAIGQAVQGNTTLTCPTGSGNLTGGGDVITLGSGGACSAIDITSSPIFAGTLDVQGSGGLTVGTNSTAGVIKISDGSATMKTASITVGTLGSDQSYALPTTGGTICVYEAGNCTGSNSGGITGSGTTSQNYLPKFSNAGGTTVTNSSLYNDATGVSVGGSSPAALFNVGASNQFQVSSAGAVTAVGVDAGAGLIQGTGGLTIGGTTTLSSLTSAGGQCLTTDGSGVLSLVSCLSGAGGGSGGVVSLNGLSGTLSINNASGSGSAVTIDDAKADGSTKGIAAFNSTNFSAASGVINTAQNIDSTATPTFGGLTLSSALTVGNGGTGSTTAAGARSNLGAAASGANSDITSLTGLTTALSVSQGGTGLTSVSANRILLGGASNSITQLATGSSGQCLVSNGAGSDPTWQSCTGSGAVTSLNGETGAITIANASAAAGTITIDDAKADGATKGIAAFDSSNFTDSAGVINTIQGIATTSSPTFAALSLTSALTVGNGGTGSTTAAGARSNLGAAASGANSDITSLTGLTTALVIGEGGTGSTTAAGARSNLGAAASGANSDITSILGLTTALSVSQGGTGLTSITDKQLLIGGAGNTVTQLSNGSSGQCLVSNGAGSAPSFQTCTGAGGVSSIDTLTGAVTLANSSGAGATITIDDAKADGSTKGIAAFNSTNFTASAGVINTVQNINTSATPTFGGLTLGSALTVGNGGTGSTTAAGARSNLGAAASGANSDITSLSGLTTALSIGQGGTGSTSAAGARSNLGAAASGANSDITSLSGLTTALSVSQGGTGLNSVTANQILIGGASNTITQLANGSSGQCLVSNGAGSAPTFQTCTGAGGVSSLDGQTGSITLANSSGASGTITIDDAKADGSTKGIAAFDSTNFTASAGIINTIQGISTSATPSFAGLTLTGGLNATTISASGQFTSTVSTGTAPLVVASTTKVVNFNADLLDGLDSTAFAAGSGSGNYIQNQNASQQSSANFWISGSARSDTSVLTPLLDTATGVALNIGTTNATVINLNQNSVLAAGKSFTITGSGTRPLSPTEGMLYYDTSTHTLVTYNGTKWVADKKQSVIVAASNSTQAQKDAADYVASGSGDQSTINAALTAASGGTVYLMPGTYTINGTISIPDNTVLSGSANSTLIALAAGASSYNAIENANTSNGGGVIVRDLMLDGSAATGGTQNGIYYNALNSDSEVTDVISSSFSGHDLELDNSSLDELSESEFVDVLLDNSAYIADFSKTQVIFLALDNSSYVSTFHDNSILSGATMDNSASIQSFTGNLVSSLTLTNTSSIDNLSGNTSFSGFDINDSTVRTVSDNYLTGDITMENGANVKVVSGNRLNALVVSDSNGINIAANSIGAGISLTNSSILRITGNDITGSTLSGYAIDITDSGSSSNYIADNSYLSGGIHDLGTGTVYGGQTDGSGNFVITPTSGGSINLNANTVVSGTLQAASSNFQVDASGHVKLALDATTGTTLVCQNGSGNLSQCSGSYLAPTASNFIQNQTASTQTAGFKISGTGTAATFSAGTSVITPLLDTAWAVALDIGATSSVINLNQSTTIFGDTIIENGHLLDLRGGGITLEGTGTINYTSPLGATIQTKINVPNFDPGAYGQIIALGLPSTADTNARAITLLDARTGSHQPTLTVLSPDENGVFGLSWDGSNTTSLLKTSVNNLALQANGINVLTATNSSGSGLLTLNGSFDQSASTGTFKTGTGAVSLNGNTTLAAGKTISITGDTYTNISGIGSPTEGMTSYDTTNKQLLTYSNGKWKASSQHAIVVAASNSSQADKNAADYVATGTNDQTIINSALTDADPAGSGRKTGKVVLLAGTYTTSDTISVPNNTTLAGEGSSTLIQFANLGGAAKAMITNTTTGGSGTGVVIRDLALDGLKATNNVAGDWGVYLNGVGTTTTSGVPGGTVSGLTISNFAERGIYLSATYLSNIINNTVYGTGSIGNSGGIYITGNRNNINNNILYANTTYGLVLNGSLYDVADGNNVYSNATGGILLNGNSQSNALNGNDIHNNGGGTTNEGIVITSSSGAGSSDNLITGNHITDTACSTNCYAIDIQDATVNRTYIANNSFDNAVTYSLHNLGTGTIYGGQMDGSGNFIITPASGGTIQLQGDTTVTGKLTVSSGGSLYTQKGTDYATNGNATDVNFGNASLYRLTGSALQTIQSIAGGADGRLLTLVNAGSVNAVIKNQYTTGTTASMRIITGTGADFTLPVDASVTLVYDAGASRWRLIGSGSGSGSYVSLQGSTPGTADTGNLNISGTGIATTLQASTFDAASAVTLNIGTTNATSISLNQNTTLASGKILTITGDTYANISAIGSPTQGMVSYDTTNKQLLVYSNGKWQADRTNAVLVAASNSSQADKNAADYVATGTSDQTPINSALTAASGKQVVLLAGTYTIDGSISVPNNTTLSGVGRGTLVQMKASFGSGNLSMITNSDQSTGTGVTVRDLRIDGNNTTNNGSGLKIGVVFSSMGGGSGTSARAGGKILNVEVSNIWWGGLWLASSNNNVISGNTVFTSNASNGPNYGILDDSSSSNNTFTGNTVEAANTGFSIGGNNNVFTSNYAISDASAGYTIGGNSNTLTGNTAANSGGDGFYVSSSSYNTLTGNTSTGNANRGIQVQFSSYNNISSNNLYDNGGSANNNAINLFTSSNNSFIGNNIYDSSATTNNYGINDNNNGSGNYFSNNSLNGSGINGTTSTDVFVNQMDASGNLLNNTNGGGFGINVSSVTASLSLQGGLVTNQLATPVIGSVTNTGTTGSTTYRYQVTATDGTGETAGSTIAQTTTGNATLNGTNYNTVSWAAIPGAITYNIYKCSGAACTPLKKTSVAGNVTSYKDQSAGSPVGAAPATNTTAGATLAGLITGNQGITVSGGAVNLTGNANSTITTTSGTLTLDSASTISLGTTNATAVTIGRSAITTSLASSVIELGPGDGSTPTAATIRGAAAAGSNIQGADMTFDASNGTGSGGSGAIVFRTAAGATASVTVNTASNQSDTSSTSATPSQTFSYSVGAQSNRLLLVGINTNATSGSTGTVTSVTYNGAALTQLAAQNCGAGGQKCRIEVWYIKEATIGSSGAHNLVVNYSNPNAPSTLYYSANVIQLSDVDQTNTFPTQATNSGNGTTSSVSVPSTNTNELVLDFAGGQGDTFTANGAQTQMWMKNNLSDTGAASRRTGVLGSTSMSWALNADPWAEVGVAVNPATNSTVDTLSERLRIDQSGQTTITGSLQQQSGAFSLTGNAASSITTTSGNLLVDSAAVLNLGTTGATSVNIGHGTIATAITGNVGITNTNATTTLSVSTNTTPTTAALVVNDTSGTGTDKLVSLNASGTPKFTVDAAGNVIALGSVQAVGLTTTSGGSLATQKGTDYATNGNATDVNFGSASLYRLTGTALQTIQSIAGTADGRQLTLVNAGAVSAVIKNQFTTGTTATMRIITGTGADFTLPVDASVTLIYDNAVQRWRLIGSGSGTGTYVNLQGATPGTADSGNLNITGTGIFGTAVSTVQLTATGQTVLGGGSNQVQLIVKANASQDAGTPLIKLQSSTGTELAHISADGKDNLFFGALAGTANTGGTGSNIGIGSNALAGLTSGNSNIAIGVGAGAVMATSTGNLVIGYGAGGTITGNDNVVLGRAAGGFGASDSNIAVGTSAGCVSGAGANFYFNVFLGVNAGCQDSDNFATNSPTLQRSTALGYDAQVQSTRTIVLGGVGTDYQQVVIGSTMSTGTNPFSVSPLIYSTGNASQSGNTITGSGTTWNAANNVRVGERFIFANGTDGGTITAVNSTTSLTVSTSQSVSSQHYRIHNVGFQIDASGNAAVASTSTTALQIQDANSVNLFTADTTNSTIKVSGTTTTFAILQIDNAHFKSTQTTKPTIGTPTNCGGGTGPSATVANNSTDAAGSFTITAGTTGSPTTCDTVLTFNKAYGAAPKSIIVTAQGSATASARQVYVSASGTTTFTVKYGTSPATSEANTYYYWVVE